jgi:hypothetical protein
MTDRRTALGLGLAASAVALSGRGAARADALSIGPTGVNIDSLQVEKGLTVAGDAELKNSLTVVGDGRLGKSLTVTGDATLRNSLTVSGADGAKSLRVSPATAGANLLDVQSATRVSEANHPKGLALYVTADGSGADGLAEFRHSNGSQGIGIGYNTIYATGSNPNQDLILKARGTGRVKITGTLEAKDFAADANPLRNRMYPEAPIVYQDIFDALNVGAIQKFGNPTYDDTTYRGQSLWGERHIIRLVGTMKPTATAPSLPFHPDTIPSGCGSWASAGMLSTRTSRTARTLVSGLEDGGQRTPMLQMERWPMAGLLIINGRRSPRAAPESWG